MIAVSPWRFDFVIDAGFVQFLEQPLIEVFPVEVAEVGWDGFDANDRESSRICLELLQHLSHYALLCAQSQRRLAYARWTTYQDQRAGNCFTYGVAEVVVGLFEFRMCYGVGAEVTIAHGLRLFEQCSWKSIIFVFVHG